MNSKEIKKIKYQGNDIKKIMHSGGVIWQGLKTWKKYSVKEVNTDKYKWSDGYLRWYDDEPDLSYTRPQYRVCEAEKTYDWFKYVEKCKTFKWSHTLEKPNNGDRFVKWISIYINEPYLAGYGYATNSYGGVDGEYFVDSYFKIYETKQVQGDYIEDVEAEENTYPKNGIKDGFWYVLKEGE